MEDEIGLRIWKPKRRFLARDPLYGKTVSVDAWAEYVGTKGSGHSRFIWGRKATPLL